MHAHADPRPSRPAPPAGGAIGLADPRALTRRSLALRAVALELLEMHRVQMKRSRDVLERAHALGARLDAALGTGASATPVARATRAVPARERVRCMVSGCSRPSPFRPCFVVGCGDHRVIVRDLPLRLCAEHRGDLDALFRRPSILDALREKLRARGRGPPDAVRVLFDVVA